MRRVRSLFVGDLFLGPRPEEARQEPSRRIRAPTILRAFAAWPPFETPASRAHQGEESRDKAECDRLALATAPPCQRRRFAECCCESQAIRGIAAPRVRCSHSTYTSSASPAPA